MRNWIIGAAALLAVAAPGVASATASGYVGAVYSNTDFGNGGGNDNAWGAQGSVAFSGSSSIGFELDGSIIDPDHGDTAYGATGHVFTRDDSYLFGGFVGVQSVNSSTTWDAGLEANAYFDNWTLAGAVGYANNSDADASAWGIDAQLRYFPMDNLRLQANAGWASIDFGGPGGNDDAWTAGVGAEYQFSSIPISIAVNYDHDEINDEDVSANVWTVALRYNWGGTLRDRDRHGASQADLTSFGTLLGL